MKKLWSLVVTVCISIGVMVRVNGGEVEQGFLMTSDGLGIFYCKVGSGSRTVILPARLFAFKDFEWLSEKGYTLISYDMRNRGRSESVADGSRLTIEADVADLESVRRHFEVERFSVIGYSYLGLMVVLYALEHPENVERIVQLGPVPMRFGTEYPADLKAVSEPDPEAVAHLRKLRAEQVHVTRPQEYCIEEWNLINRPRLVGNPRNVDVLPTGDEICSMPNEWPVNLARHMQHQFLGSVRNLEPPVEGIRQLDIPVLTIHGRLDLNAPYGSGREWAMILPNARLLTIDKGAHQSFAEYPDLVRPAIEAFLAGGWPEKAEKVTKLETGEQQRAELRAKPQREEKPSPLLAALRLREAQARLLTPLGAIVFEISCLLSPASVSPRHLNL